MKNNQLQKEWKEVELGEVCEIDWGNTSITKKSYVLDGYPTFSASGKDGFLKDYEFEGDAVILSAIGARCGKCFLTEGKWNAIKNTIIIFPKEFISIKFLFFQINNETFWARSGAGQPFLTLKSARLEKVKIPFLNGKPDIQIQKQIVAILEKAEALKQRREEADKLTKEYLKSVFYEMFLKSKEKFEEVELSKVIKKVTDGKHGDCDNLENSGYYFISAKDIFDGKVHYENSRQIKSEGYLEVNKRVNLEVGDVLVTNSGTIGKNAIMNDKDKVKRTTFQKSVAIIKPDYSLIQSIYLKYFLDTIIPRLMGTSSGSSQKNLLLKDIRSIEIPLPPLPLQQKFANIVEKVEKLKEKQKQSKEEINIMFDALMQKAFKGELVR